MESDHGWERHIEVLVFLYWPAHAASYTVVSQTFDILKTSVHDIVHRVSRAVLGILRKVICFPTGDDLEAVGVGSAQLARSPAFSRAVGAIDGCHIRIKPPANNSHCYYNRKLFHSIQLQAITDHRGKFLDIFVGYPGEPVQNPVQARFNSKHSRAWNIIERAFGMMKTRWRSVFFKALEISPAFVPEVVACCAVLHNLTLLNGDIVEAEDEEDHDDGPPKPHNPQARVGDHIRDNLAAAVSAPNICVAALHEHDYL
ncbi:nuclease HARBI1 [Labeo rohita]|uniref:Nuclease HARBI1 n=1 Tax=Labeo rohita TaxID=84645 RepID=A0A498LAD0_LABRO|nr:nuclease HARBI1 [Labeo rohita]